MEASSPQREKMANDPEFQSLPSEKKINIEDQQSEKIIKVWNTLISDVKQFSSADLWYMLRF